MVNLLALFGVAVEWKFGIAFVLKNVEVDF